MEHNYPQNLIDQYLKASSKLKKFERIVFKRFAPNVSEVLYEFSRLALKFEECGIYQYAAMCHLGVAKCEVSVGNTVNECFAYLKAARAFLKVHNETAALHLRSESSEFKEGALRCYTHALDRVTDDGVMKAAIIREMRPLQPHYDGTSTFASPTHRIHELELAAHNCVLVHRDFLPALQHLDDIVDNIYERKQQALYEDLLRRAEIERVLLLVLLNLPPARQSPSHIKLIEYYYDMANFEQSRHSASSSSSGAPGAYIPIQQQYALAEIVLAWSERRDTDLTVVLHDFLNEFQSLNAVQRFLIKNICDNLGKRN